MSLTSRRTGLPRRFQFRGFSRHAERIELVLYDDVSSDSPLVIVDLSGPEHRTGDIWHALVAGMRWGQAYSYRAYGAWAPEKGQRFNGAIELLDPRALAVRTHPHATPDEHCHRSLLVDRSFDWQGTTRPRRAWSETLLYETHVRGFTVDGSSGVKYRGTFLGVAEKIPYLQTLGVTAIELMPVQAFDDVVPTGRDPSSGQPLYNYWGYNPIALFAPHPAYASTHETGSEVSEFKEMVRELHRHGIEVILDIVFTHTAEGAEHGTTYSLRGFDDGIYYLHDDMKGYADYSGCGNSLNCNHPVVRDYIIDCLRYWSADMQVDGFRFDLASILGRDEHGGLLRNPPLLERIAEDPVLRDVKLIAEAWDAGGAYQVGSFSSPRWAEWNGRFRDDVRRFWRGDVGMAGAFAMRICGSPDLYSRNGKAPVNSINFVACHDGFTLNDVVSYANKHNAMNGADNRDGMDENCSANYGVEGESGDIQTQQLRQRQIRNLLATLALSRGVPMLLGGDEFGRTQLGNNNPYCQDNRVSWYDWRLVERNAELVRFTRELMNWRKRHSVFSAGEFYTEDQLHWFAPEGGQPDWQGPTFAIGCLIRRAKNGVDVDADGESSHALCLLFNAAQVATAFQLPERDSHRWCLVMDTGQAAPDHLQTTASQTHEGASYTVDAHALAVLSSGISSASESADRARWID